MVDETKFFAWLDGELPAEEAARVAREVANDPELTRAAEEHRAMAVWLRQSFDRAAEAPMPERLQKPLEAAPAEVVDLAERRESRRRGFSAPVAQWTAMAATLVMGVFVGALATRDMGLAPVEIRGGTLYAAGTVNQALEEQLASAGAVGAARIGLTFRDQQGSVCRTFQVEAASGLACRDDGDWAIRGMFAAGEGSASEYRMASGPDPRLMELVDSTIEGEPFDAAAEAQAKRAGWR